MQDAAVFWDRVSAKYAKQPIADEDAYQLTLGKTKGYLKPNDTVLEVGCGTGSTALLLAPHVEHITATDISGKMIEIGKSKAKEQNIANAKFLRADVFDDILARETYDAVLAHNMLHLLEDAPGALKKIHTLLKPDGMFISKTVCKLGSSTPIKWRILKLVLPIMQFFGKAPYVNFMDAEDWEKQIISAGFKIIESGNYPKTAMSRYIVAQKI